MIKIGYYDEVKNFGDILSPYLIKKLFNEDCIHTDWTECELISCGSIIDKVNYNQGNRTVAVWGSGAMWSYHSRENYVMQILATRGKLTADNFGHKGAIGDPALLLPLIIPKKEPTKELGIIPHYTDKEKAIEYFGSENIIDIQTDPEEFTSQLLNYKYIISSSLHGLITADAYQIPNVCVKFSNNILGDDFKYWDYYSIYDKQFKFVDLRKQCTEKELGWIQNHLVEYQPYNLNKIQKDLIQKFNDWNDRRKQK